MGVMKVILVVAIVVLIPVVIIGADVGLSVSSISSDSVSIDNLSVSLGNDNKTVTFSADVSIAAAGFIPKSVVLNLVVKEGSTTITEETVEIPIGASTNIQVEFSLTNDQVNTIRSGGSVTITVSGTVQVKYLGITVPGLGFDLGTIASETISA